MSNIHANYIAGLWRTSQETYERFNPSDTRELIGQYAQASVEDVNDAFVSAHAAAPAWGTASPLHRADILDKVAQSILSRKEELGQMLAREEGKTLLEAIGEVTRAGHIFRFFSQEALRLHGQTGASVRPGIDVHVTREPVGVVGIISPWNFPIAIPAWKIAPALAFGNAVVFKPAEWAPASAWLLTEILHQAGIPPGVFNLTMGPGSVVGQAMVDHPLLNALTFTGSQLTGARLAQSLVARPVKLQMEMGGKNPLIVVDDAKTETAIESAVQSGFYSTGQRCTASSRILVTAGIHDEFVDKLTQAVSKLRVGHAMHADTQIGPVVHERQLASVMGHVKQACDDGARLAVGGKLAIRESPGHYMMPTLLADTAQEMRINHVEVFGPVVSVTRVADYEQALYLANASEFGLSAGIVTESLSVARHFQRHAQAGMVMVNLPTAGVDFHVPFGGIKGSSHGSREQGEYAKEFYTRVKTAYVR